MTFSDLLAFVTGTMRMSHIYQPLLTRALVDAGGMTTVSTDAISQEAAT